MSPDVPSRVRHHGEKILLAAATRSAPLATLAASSGLAAAWSLTYLSGGTRTAMLHVFYLPVAFAASRFRHTGALVVAVCAGLLAGPFMPLDVAASTSQQPVNWMFRLGFFVVTGQAVALLCHQSLDGLSTAVGDRRMKAELETALHQGQFRVVYQPLFELATRTMIGVEALLRWEHPRSGTVAPDKFICAAERTGAIIPIGTWVLQEAVRQAAEWRARTPAATLKVAVNVSARQLEDNDLAAKVASALRDSGLPPAALQLEVTETALITDITGVSRRLKQLRELGVGIAIDDFGTGQSSLAYLHRFPADVIKIDRSFIKALKDTNSARAVAEGIVRLSASLGATTVAEGIETEEQANILRILGCHIGQGYLYAAPSHPEQISDILPLVVHGEQRTTAPAMESALVSAK